jgi:type IV pilus assembly protein PilW
MTLIELMVGMVVALLVGLAAAGSAQMFVASQRQGMSTGTAALNVTSTLTGIKSDLSAAGLGFFGRSNYLCNNLNLSVGNEILVNGTAISPLSVTRGAAYDTISVLYAGDVAGGAPVRLKQASAGTSASLRSLLPVDLTDGKTPAVLMAPQAPGAPCTVRTVTGATPADAITGVPQVLSFDAGGLHNQRGFIIGPNYAERDFVSLLGTLTWNVYSVDDDRQLIVNRRIQNDSAVLATNVVAFRAEYGMANAAAGANGRLESWASPADVGPLNAANVKRLRAIRIGVLTRSQQPEKPDENGACTATTEMPRLFPEDADAVAPDLADGTWQCYRYRASVVVIPMRNVVW